MDSKRKLLLSRRFTSFEELVVSVVAWDLNLRQVSRNYSDTTLEQFQVGKILVSHLTCGCFATHAGATPKGMYTVAVPDPGCPEFRYSGRLIDRPAMIVAREGEEFNLITRPGYGIFTFSVPQIILEKYCEKQSAYSLGSLQKFRNQIIFVDPDSVMNLIFAARAITGSVKQLSNTQRPAGSERSLDSNLLEHLINSLPHGNRAGKEPGATACARIFKRALDVIKDHELEPLFIPDLASAVNTTERTLERAFNRELGISPKKYLLGQRMSGVHKELWRSSASETSVADIANAWGFWHMGQFAKDYRSYFDELPSETLRRSV